MRWFEHRTDAGNNKKIRKIKIFYKERGGQAVMAAVGRFWSLMEIVGQQGQGEDGFDSFSLPDDYGLDVLADDLCCTVEELREFLDLLVKVNSIDGESWQNEEKIYAPKLGERADNYSKRLKRIRTVVEQCSNSVRTNSGKVRECTAKAEKCTTKVRECTTPQTQTQTQVQRQKRKKDTPLPPKIKTSLPENFTVSESVRDWAAKKGFDRLEEHLEAFIARCLMKDYQNVDWDAAFKTAIREDWGKIRQRQGGLPALSGGGKQPLSKAAAVTAANLAAREEALQ